MEKPQPAPKPESPKLAAYRREEKGVLTARLKSSLSIAENIRRFLNQADIHLEFLQKEGTREIVARVVHSRSGEIVREYPVIRILKYFGGTDRTR